MAVTLPVATAPRRGAYGRRGAVLDAGRADRARTGNENGTA